MDDGSTWVFVGVASALMFVASLIALPVMIRRAPRDFFTRTGGKKKLMPRVAQNLFAWVLVVAGIAMLVLPGQGLLTLVLGICLADFPGKHRLIRALLRNDRVWAGLAAFRKRMGSPPFERPRAS